MSATARSGRAGLAAAAPHHAQAVDAYGLLRSADDEHAYLVDEWRALAGRAGVIGLWGGLCFAAGGLADYVQSGPHAPWTALLLVRAVVLAAGLYLAWGVRARSGADPARLRLRMGLFQVLVLVGLRAVVQLHAQASPGQAVAGVFACMVIYAYAPMLRPWQLWIMPTWLVLTAMQMHFLLAVPVGSIALFVLLLGFANIIGWRLATHTNRLQRTAWLDRRRLQWEIGERVTAEQNLRHLFEASPMPLVLAAQPHGQILRMNDAARKLLDPQQLLTDTAMAADFYADPQTRPLLDRAIAHHAAFGPVDLRLRNTSQRVFDVMLSARKLRYTGRRAVLVSLVEITHRKRREHELRRLAHTDPLTALHNRRGFFARAERLRQRGGHAPLALLALDVDHFKTINDTHGHATGDIVLQQLAGRMLALLRNGDVLARIGGEEFAALLPATTQAQAMDLAERMRLAVCAHAVRCQGLRLNVSVSIGVTLVGESDSDLDAALARADEAMYRAKQQGRNLVRWHEPAA